MGIARAAFLWFSFFFLLGCFSWRFRHRNWDGIGLVDRAKARDLRDKLLTIPMGKLKHSGDCLFFDCHPASASFVTWPDTLLLAMLTTGHVYSGCSEICAWHLTSLDTVVLKVSWRLKVGLLLAAAMYLSVAQQSPLDVLFRNCAYVRKQWHDVPRSHVQNHELAL